MLNAPQISFLIILVVAFTLLITERIRSDLVAVLIVLSLAVTRVLTPAEALSGFGSEPAIVVVSIFVMSAAFRQTGLAETIGQKIGKLAGQGYSRIVVVLMSSVALLSAFTHHVTTTAVMLPVTMDAEGVAHTKDRMLKIEDDGTVSGSNPPSGPTLQVEQCPRRARRAIMFAIILATHTTSVSSPPTHLPAPE